MTVEDQKKLRDGLRIELEDAERDLAHESELLRQYGSTLEVVAQWLREMSQGEPPTLAPSSRPNLNTVIRTAGHYKECLDFDHLVRTVDSFKLTRDKVFDLRKRFGDLTRSSYFKP